MNVKRMLIMSGACGVLASTISAALAQDVNEVAEVVMKPLNEVEMAGEDAQRMQKLIDALESLDDVQEVYTSAVLAETV